MLKKAVILSSILLSSGCAFTVHDVKMDYAYKQPISVDLSTISQAPIQIGKFEDSRNETNPRMIMHIQNLYGETTSGGWQAEKPIADIVKDALEDGLKKAGASISKNAEDVVLEGELIDFDYDVIMGMWEGTLKSRLSVKIQLKNKSTNTIIWKDTYISSASVKGGEGAEGLLRATLDDLVTDLLSDGYFLQELKG